MQMQKGLWHPDEILWWNHRFIKSNQDLQTGTGGEN